MQLKYPNPMKLWQHYVIIGVGHITSSIKKILTIQFLLPQTFDQWYFHGLLLSVRHHYL
jgi:hypothetical protein